jgi:hypothetical protein
MSGTRRQAYRAVSGVSSPFDMGRVSGEDRDLIGHVCPQIHRIMGLTAGGKVIEYAMAL